jgi:hypothetical protein
VADPAPAPQPGAPTAPTYSSYASEVPLAMDIQSLFALGQNQIPFCADMLADALQKIGDTLSNLNQDWAGPSQQDQQDINDRWNAAGVSMFGTQSQPELGIVNRIGAGIESAASNYDLAETVLVQLYQTYTQSIMDLLQGVTPPPDSGDSADAGLPPITEV